MKKMLIIHPHWPPSNTVGVHRVRLIANELQHFGWKATVLTVDERDIEDDLSPELLRLVDASVEVVKVRARPVRQFMGKRLVGDIGLRAFTPLKKKAEELLSASKFDFIWFSLPSWYTPIMGPSLRSKFDVQYGVDYRDPWVYRLAPSQRGLNRATATVALARLLEPLALRKVSLISGVSDGYLAGIVERYPEHKTTQFLTFQMGFRKEDHFVVLDDFAPPFTPDKRTYVYAGAYAPNWYPLFRLWMQGLAACAQSGSLKGVEFLFIGTGNPELQSISDLAAEFGVAELVREIPERMPFLQVQQILRNSAGALVIGSIEPHYSASKIFQCLITSPRVFAFFHEQSEGLQILRKCNATNFFAGYNNQKSDGQLINELAQKIEQFGNEESPWDPQLQHLEAHSARTNAATFATVVESLLPPKP